MKSYYKMALLAFLIGTSAAATAKPAAPTAGGSHYSRMYEALRSVKACPYAFSRVFIKFDEEEAKTIGNLMPTGTLTEQMFERAHYDSRFYALSPNLAKEWLDDKVNTFLDAKSELFLSDPEVIALSETYGEKPTIGVLHKAARQFFHLFRLGSPIMNGFLEAHPELEDLPVTPENITLLTKAENAWIEKHRGSATTVGDYLAILLPRYTFNAREELAMLASKAILKYPDLPVNEAMDLYIDEDLNHDFWEAWGCPFTINGTKTQ